MSHDILQVLTPSSNPTFKGANKYELPRNLNKDILRVFHGQHQLLAQTIWPSFYITAAN